MSVILCIDTATEYSGAGICDGKSCFFRRLQKDHVSDQILENIDTIINDNKKTLSDINGVIVIKGPGSFTGLRVGVSVANQFAHQLNIPISGITADDLYADMTDDKDFLYLQSMNRDQAYVRGHGKYESLFPAGIINISELGGRLGLESIKWTGQLNDSHKSMLGMLQSAQNLTIENAWNKVILKNPLSRQKKYDLIEPFYGKDPTITKSKKSE